MRIITLVLVIFLAQCAHLLKITDNAQVRDVKDALKEIRSDIDQKVDDIGEKAKDVGEKVKDIGEKMVDAMEKVIPPCIFGVKSVSMFLFTRDIPFGKVLTLNESSLDIDRTKRVAFLVHGFISSANNSNTNDLASELVKKDYTVFSLDWSEGACTTGLPVIKFTGYPSAVQNTREIGDLMASYVMLLMEKGIPLDNMIFIGHSLGAHVSGFAAKKIQQSGYGVVPRLIAADPAAPLFMHRSCPDRLCISDAKRVIVLHTSELGISKAIGHVDLYMDYGIISQPGCSLVDLICSHSRSILYLTDILNDKCGFPGVSVSTMDIMIRRKITYPGPDTTKCIFVTNKIFENDDITEGKYYVFVNSETPFCTDQSFSCQQ